LQDVFLQDKRDFVEERVGDHKVFGKLELGDKLDVEQIDFSTGGGGTNIAVGLARGGHRVYFWGSVAADVAGRAVLEALAAERVNADYVNFSREKRTGYSVVLLAPSGERTILTHRGASAEFEHVTAKDLRAMRPDWLSVTTTYGQMGVLRELFADCAEQGVRVMWNPGKYELKHRRELLSLAKYVDVLLLNRKEANLLLGLTTSTAELAQRLDELVDVAIVTDGKYGLVAAREGKRYRTGLYEDVKVVDTTGAGDAFGSGFLTEFAHSGDLQRALVYGSANSTAVVQKIGAKYGLLHRRTVKLKNIKVEEIS
jgi:sugar/nucleoside kinase (ribokinase family)